MRVPTWILRPLHNLCWWRSPSKGWSSQAVGRAGERQAAKFLRSKGLRILDRNVVTRTGEADLVARDDRSGQGAGQAMIVLVEVKTRVVDPGQENAAFSPEAQINPAKRRKLLSVMDDLVRANGWGNLAKRIDVVAVVYVQGQHTPIIRHYVDAVRKG
jgi:putative endonuclease